MGQGHPAAVAGGVTRGWLVTGRVQGVGFRYFVRRTAEGLGLTGWVRNMPDGRVEVLGQGTAPALVELGLALAQGPRRAVVTDLNERQISDEVESYKSFEVR